MSAEELAKFSIYLRSMGSKIDEKSGLGKQTDFNISDTSLIYAISGYLNIDFKTAQESVNKALGI
ncbi:MAG: hypothetical protein WC119_04540 [Synergistaceae bacterium]